MAGYHHKQLSGLWEILPFEVRGAWWFTTHPPVCLHTHTHTHSHTHSLAGCCAIHLHVTHRVCTIWHEWGSVSMCVLEVRVWRCASTIHTVLTRTTLSYTKQLMEAYKRLPTKPSTCINRLSTCILPTFTSDQRTMRAMECKWTFYCSIGLFTQSELQY